MLRRFATSSVGARRLRAVSELKKIDHTPVYPREAVKRALELSATAIILVHPLAC